MFDSFDDDQIVMKAFMRTTLLTVVLTILAMPLQGQPFPGNSRQRAPMLPISVDVVPLFASNPDTVVVRVDYRISGRFFVYMRNEAGPADSAFRAHGELLFELRRPNESSVGRYLRLFDLYRRSQTSTNRLPTDIQGTTLLAVPPGSYRLLVSLDDKQSGRSIESQRIVVDAPRMSAGSISISPPIFVEPRFGPTESTQARFQALNRGGDVLFGAPPGGCLVQVAGLSQAEPFSVQWKITNRPLHIPDAPREFEGTEVTTYAGSPVSAPMNGSIIYTVNAEDSSFTTLFVPLPLEKLEEGSCSFEIKLKSAGTETPHMSEFTVIWEGKPRSLLDLDMAIDALQHIATEKELDALSEATTSGKAEALGSFWRKRDRDTTTAYNEAMAEYYRRVDLSIARFSGNEGPNGYKTDRGRVLILYGTPSDSRRLFGPNQDPREVWTYDTLRKRFTFTETSRNGEFALTKVEDL